MSQFDQVSVIKKANVYFDGKCVSHSVLFADGTRKSVGVIMPNAVLTFNTGAPEIMEIIDGSCRANIAESEWKTYQAGEQFNVAANTRFDIEALNNSPVHYVCHFG
jgi:purine/pyrimidine-nucleoside phosphorylase